MLAHTHTRRRIMHSKDTPFWGCSFYFLPCSFLRAKFTWQLRTIAKESRAESSAHGNQWHVLCACESACVPRHSEDLQPSRGPHADCRQMIFPTYVLASQRLINERTTMRVGVCPGSSIPDVFFFHLYNSNAKTKPNPLRSSELTWSRRRLAVPVNTLTFTDMQSDSESVS